MLQQTQSTPPHESEDSEALVEIHGLSLRGPRLGLPGCRTDGPADRLTVITGSAGAGRTSLCSPSRAGCGPARAASASAPTPSPGGSAGATYRRARRDRRRQRTRPLPDVGRTPARSARLPPKATERGSGRPRPGRSGASRPGHTTQPARPRARSRRPSDARCRSGLLNRPLSFSWTTSTTASPSPNSVSSVPESMASPETASPSSPPASTPKPRRPGRDGPVAGPVEGTRRMTIPTLRLGTSEVRRPPALSAHQSHRQRPVFIPLLYSGMYLWSFWDPYGRLKRVRSRSQRGHPPRWRPRR